MKLNLHHLPFTCRDSYLVVSDIDPNFRIMGKSSGRKGLYLRSVRGGSRYFPFITKIEPMFMGNAAAYTYEAEESKISIRTEGGMLEIAFADQNTLMIRGSGKEIGVRLTEWSDPEGGDGFLMPLLIDGREYYKANVFKNDTTLYLGMQYGTMSVHQDWEATNAENCVVTCASDGSGFLLCMEESRAEWTPRPFDFIFDQCVEETKKRLSEYAEKMPSIPEELSESKKMAAYINWESRVAKDGILTRNAVYPSKNWMVGAFSWDQCFIAQALSYHLPEEAWDQFMIMFDYQDDSGRIPDAVSDNYTVMNFCKPPVHGWTFLRLLERMAVTKSQIEEAYQRLSAWTNWWYRYRDNDHDGVCCYHHGNDSGWDNSTVFSEAMVIESADLSAELCLQCEALAKAAEMLGRKEEQDYWTHRSEQQLQALLEHCFDGDRPVAVDQTTHKVVECDSLLPYTSILLGKRLPESKRNYIVRALREEFLTEYGFATEKVTSKLYDPDGYWRGPIWAPTMLMVLDGLWDCGEKELAREAAGRFVRLVQQNGFSENFNSVTGEGNRDHAFSWSASSFLVIAHEFLS